MNNNDFFSIDKLVEFGMSAAIASQMVNSMNQSMRGMYMPGSMMSMPPASQPQAAIPAADDPMKNIYIIMDGNRVGPLNESEFMQLVHKGSVTKETQAWYPGADAWRPVMEMPQLLKIIALS